MLIAISVPYPLTLVDRFFKKIKLLVILVHMHDKNNLSFFFKNYIQAYACIDEVHLLPPTIFCSLTRPHGALMAFSLGSEGLTRRRDNLCHS